MHGRVEVERQRRGDRGEVGRREEEARVEVHGQVRPRGRRAAEDVHAVVQGAGEVRVHEREGVAVDEGPQRRVAVVRRVEGGDVAAVAEAQQVEGLVAVELPRALGPHAVEQLVQAI